MAQTSTVPAAILDRVRKTIVENAGLVPPDWVLEARLAERMKALGVESGMAYVSLLGSEKGAAELSHLVEALRVGETRFFRHRAHIAAIENVAIPTLNKAGSHKLRVWSAGCATGEEAYTLAIVLARKLGARRQLEVLATDISADALEIARARTYSTQAVKNVPSEVKAWAFERTEERWRVADHIAQCVRFEQHNLALDRYPRKFDLILCRNVLIYFGQSGRTETINRLIDSLVEGGFLFVGYSESLRDFSALDAIHTPQAVLFRKITSPAITSATRPEIGSNQPQTRTALSANEHVGPAVAPTVSPSVIAEEAVIELSGRYDNAERLSRELSSAIAGPFRQIVVDLDGADYLGEDAAAVLKRARAAARAAGVGFHLVAHRSGTRRWLRRSQLSDENSPTGGSE